jgi:hypothetical protein
VAARHDLGTRQPGRRTCLCGRPARVGRGGRGGARRVRRSPRSGHRGGGTQRGLWRVRAGPRRGAARPHRPERDPPCRRRVDARRRRSRHLRRPPRGGAAERARSHARALASVGGALHGRRLVGMPIGRAAVQPLRQDRGPGGRPRRGVGQRAPHQHRRVASRRGGTRPHPGVRRVRGDARHHHRCPAPPPTGARDRVAPGVRVRHLGRGDGCLPAHPASRRQPCGAPAVRPGGVRPQLPDRRAQRVAGARRGRSRHRRGQHGRRRRRVRTHEPSGSTTAWSSGGSATATRCRRSRAS